MKFNILHSLLGFVVLATAQDTGIPELESSTALETSTTLELSSTVLEPSSTLEIAASSTLAIPIPEITPLLVSTGYVETMVSMYLPSNEAAPPIPVSTPVAELEPIPTPADVISSQFLEIQSSYAASPTSIPDDRVSMVSGYNPESTSAKVGKETSTSDSAVPASGLVSSSGILSLLATSESVCLCPSATFTSTSVVISTSISIFVPGGPGEGGKGGPTCPVAITATITAFGTAPAIVLPASIVTTTAISTLTTTLTPALLPIVTCLPPATKAVLTKTIVTDTVTITKVKTIVTRIRTTLVVLVTRTKVEVVWTTNTVVLTGAVTKTSVTVVTATSTDVKTKEGN